MTDVVDGRYTIVRELGRGGQAITFLATGPDGTDVALKKLELHQAGEHLPT